MNMNFIRKLPIPKETKEMYPLTEDLARVKEQRDSQIKGILSGRDSRLLVIVGPCSADNPDAVIDYVTRLAELQEKTKDKLLLVPRVYTNKPRTTGEGYKGLLHQPDPVGRPDLFKGIVATRALHMKVLSETHLTTADEMLYPENHRYICDLLSYVSVGARSVENQQHRLVASGLCIPVGMKNPTHGCLEPMLNAIATSQRSHKFIYRGWEVESAGNPFSHAILRGYEDSDGVQRPNCHYEDLLALSEKYGRLGISNKAVIVDTNHSNSAKRFAEQPRIAMGVLDSCARCNEIKSLVKGFMIESYIEEGCQPAGGGVYGRSITDPCLGWPDTERMLLDMACRW